jgi:molecular chaperone GrpE (heat shock protein)
MSLFPAWQTLAAESDKLLKEQIVNLYEQLRHTTCEVLTEDAAHFSRLGDSDERVYDQLTRLMGAYREAVWLIEAADEPTPAVKDLLTGICDILTSRLREFEDAANPEGNPVTDEKRGIIERALLYTTRQIENQANQFPDKIAPERWAVLRGAFLIEGKADWREVLRGCFDEKTHRELYVHYQDGLRFCLLGLDDLHGRKVARFYTDLIEREWEVLETIIRIQAQALETAITESGGEASPLPDDVPARVLDILREAYQQIGPLVEGVQRLPKAAPRGGQASPCRFFEAFAETLVITFDDSIPSFSSPETQPFFDALTLETAAVFGQQRITFLKAAYQLQRMIGVEILLAEEAAALFGSAYTAIKDEEFEAADMERQIINGIAETLEIKIESLKESIKDFNGEGASLLQAFAKEKNDVTDEIKEAAYLAIRDAWLADPPTETELPCFFARCREGESFAPYRADYEKHVTHYTGKMEKAAMRFKKEILLYEVCTFEEILTHSVSRLKESHNEAVLAVASRLYETYAALEILLKKNNITPIRPAPHEIFNGKEHEVLMAEKQEGFAKGEIVKLVGSGYKHNDRVLLRANVIAAK